MKTFRRACFFVLSAMLPACGGQLVEFRLTDGARPDAGIADVAIPDATIPDAVIADIAVPDAPLRDAAIPDAVTPDEGNRDTGDIDVRLDGDGITDSGIRDTGAIEAARTDTTNVEVPRIDGPTPDASSVDTTTTDAGSIDGSAPGPVVVIDLGLAAPFAIAATAGVTNTMTSPITHINGNVALTPSQTCNAVTVDHAGGFGLCGGAPPTIAGTVITNVYPDTTTAAAIKADLNAAFLSITPLSGPPAVGSLGGGTAIAAPTTLGDVAGRPLVLGDNWFTPGVHTSITSILLTGDITLDGQGDPNAIFIFQSASTLTTADGAPSPGAHTRILLTNGTKAANVWWQVASSATMGSYSEVQGNILAAFDITMKVGATACGRSMAGAWAGGAGAFIFDSNVVSVPGNGCPP